MENGQVVRVEGTVMNDNKRNLMFLRVLLITTPLALLAESAIKHEAPKYFVTGERIALDANIESDNGITVARTYFKANDAINYNFVAMQCAKEMCKAVLPKPSHTTEGIEYLFLYVDNDKKVFKSKPYHVIADNKQEKPAYQNVNTSEKLHVSTELTNRPEAIEGFTDNILYDTVESTARFGIVAGLYTQISASSGAGATVATAGSTTATSGGISGSTLLWTAGGVALVGGGVAVAAGGGDSGGGGSSSKADPIVRLTWQSDNDLDLIVEDPCGNRIWHDAPSATCQGYTGALTKDSNSISAENNPEEIVQYQDGAPSGTYGVYVMDSLNRDGQETQANINVTNNAEASSTSLTVGIHTLAPAISFEH